MADRGKQFEDRFKKDWINTFPDSFCYRLHDQVTGYKVTSRNPCDFICYKYPYIYLIEAKSHQTNRFPFSSFPQFPEMKKYVGIPGVILGVVLWAVDFDKVLYIPLETFIKLEEQGKKSYNLKLLGNPDYPAYEIPSKKLVKFMESDYSIIEEIANGKKETE